MNDARSSRLPVTVAAVAVVTLPVLYVLSIGPLHWLVSHGYIDSESSFASVLRTIYMPVFVVAGVWQPLKSALTLYLRLWE